PCGGADRGTGAGDRRGGTAAGAGGPHLWATRARGGRAAAGPGRPPASGSGGMTPLPLKLVFLGLSPSSSWGNGHATTYRALLKGLVCRGHDIAFLERDVPWYADHRDLPTADFCRLEFYGGLDDLTRRHDRTIAEAD